MRFYAFKAIENHNFAKIIVKNRDACETLWIFILNH